MNEMPGLTWYQFDTIELSNPSGERHIEGGSFAFEKAVASGTCASGMSLPELIIEIPGYQDNYVSRPIAMICRLSTIEAGSGISGLKFYLTEDSALDGDGTEPKAFIQMAVSGQWLPNCTMPSGANDRMHKNAFPLVANVSGQAGQFEINGVTDYEVSQYIYLNVVIPSRSPIGDYGICGSGQLRFCLLYDYAQII